MDKKLFCPICGKDLYIIEINHKDGREKIVLKIWCKRCKKELIVEI